MDFSITFNEEKNQLLKVTRGICFEDILAALENGKLLADIAHPNNQRTNQKVYIVQIGQYAYAVPYVINEQKREIFLKTVYPSRVFTKTYLERKRHEKTTKK